MAKIIKETIHANGIDISVYSEDLQNDYISLTDIQEERRRISRICHSELVAQ